MAYGTIDGVRALIPQFTLSATTKPTEAQATTFVQQCSDKIDLILSAKALTVPVTTPAYFLSALVLLSEQGAAALVLKGMFPDHVGPGETPAWAFLAGEWKRGIDGLLDGSMIPSGLLTGGTKSGAPSSLNTDHPAGAPDQGAYAPMFTRDMQL